MVIFYLKIHRKLIYIDCYQHLRGVKFLDSTNLNILRGHVPLIYLTLAYCVSLNVVLYDQNLSLYLIHG